MVLEDAVVDCGAPLPSTGPDGRGGPADLAAGRAEVVDEAVLSDIFVNQTIRQEDRSHQYFEWMVIFLMATS